jgi:hypothetical protein
VIHECWERYCNWRIERAYAALARWKRRLAALVNK